MFSKIYSSHTLLPTLVLGASLLAFSISSPTLAADGTFSQEQKTELQGLFKTYIDENPQVIMDSLNAYQVNQQRQEEQRAQERLKTKFDILTDAKAPSIGPVDADVTIVEFLDYNCGYCKRALTDIQALLNKDKNVRVIFREMPILGEASMIAAKWALAAHRQGKYFEYHVALMNHRGPKNDTSLAKLAESLGLDPVQMKKDANSSEVQVEINADLELGREIGVRGTPAFVVGKKFYPGYLGPEGLKNAIDEVRKKQK